MRDIEAVTFSPEVTSEFKKIVRGARAALQFDGVAVVARHPELRYAVVACDAIEGFDIVRSVSHPLVEAVEQSQRRALHTRDNSYALAPIGEGDGFVGVLHVAKRGDGGFSGADVANVELVARELARVFAEGGPRPLVPLNHDSLVDDFELDDVSSIVTGEVEPISAPLMLGEGSFLGFGDIEPTSLLSPEGVQELLANAVTKALHITEGHVAALVLSSAEPFEVLALAATPEAPDVPTEELIATTLVARVFETGLPFVTFDAREHEFASQSASIFELSVSTVMCIPLKTQGARALSAIYCATFGIGGKYDAQALAALMAEARKLTPMLDNLSQFRRCK